MKTLKKILFFIFVLSIFPPVNFSQERTEWILNLASFGADSSTKTYKNLDGSRVFISSGIPGIPGILGVAWHRDFSPTIKKTKRITLEGKLISGVNVDSVEMYFLLQDSLGTWTFYGASKSILTNQWQTFYWDWDPASTVESIYRIQLSFQTRSGATYTSSTVFVKNLKHTDSSDVSAIIDFGCTTTVFVTMQIPTGFALEQNYPNPFNPATTIRYQLPVADQVSLKVYDLLGREVATLVNEYQPAGTHDIEFSGRDFPSGIYFYRLQGESINLVKKMMLIK